MTDHDHDHDAVEPLPSPDYVRALAEVLAAYGLHEIEVESSATRVLVRREGVASGSQPTSSLPLPDPSMFARPESRSARPPASEGPAAKLLTATLVGTFFRAPTPDADPFVSVGDAVAVGQTVGLIESMKLFNEVRAERAGSIAEVLVENGAAVEFGQALFRLQ